MIIGNNTNFQNTRNQFLDENKTRPSPIPHDNQPIQNQEERRIPNLNPLVESNRAMQHTDEMNDKAFAMLQERLNNGQITMEEFNKKCHEMGKRIQSNSKW